MKHPFYCHIFFFFFLEKRGGKQKKLMVRKTPNFCQLLVVYFPLEKEVENASIFCIFLKKMH